MRQVLEAAQRLGYAEADPAFDVGGTDAAQKLALLAAIAFGCRVDFDGISVEGIERVSLADIEHAAELGYRIRLLGVAQMTEAGLEARMQPCLVPAGSPPGQLTGVTNMVVVEGDFVGRIVLSGPGAGAGPTASAIVGDIIDIARGLVIPPFGQPAASLAVVAPAGDGAPAAYYLRFLVADAPGVLAQVAAELGAAGISINRMRQVEHAERGGAGPDRDPPGGAGGARRARCAPSRGSRSAGRRRWRSGSRRCEAWVRRDGTTGGARVRPSTEADLAAIQAIYAHHVLHGLASFEEVPPDVAEMARRRAEVLGRGLPHLVAEVDGRVARLRLCRALPGADRLSLHGGGLGLRGAGGDRAGARAAAAGGADPRAARPGARGRWWR